MDDAQWTRALTPFVVYTHTPHHLIASTGSPTRFVSTASRKRVVNADARLRNGVREAKKDAAHGQAQALAASTAYAQIRDPQGMALACMASGFARSADITVNRKEYPRREWLCARRRAKEDFLQAAALYEMVMQQPQLPYDPERQARLQRALEVAGGESDDAWHAVLGHGL